MVGVGRTCVWRVKGRQGESGFRHTGLRWLSPPGGGGGHHGWMSKCRVQGGHKSGEVHSELNSREPGPRHPLVVKWLGLGAFAGVA